VVPEVSDPLPGATVRSGFDPAVLADAVIRLRTGRLVGMPTETVYGLAGATFDPAALEAIYAIKHRPSDNPLIAHVASVDMARTLCRSWTDDADRLVAACWPGPLAIVLDRADSVPATAAGGRDSIAIRMPAHPVALRLIESLAAPVSAPSANRSGSISPTEARHVLADFAAEDLLVLDGGPCRIGLESTVVDLRGQDPIVLRPGAVTADRIAEILGVEVVQPEIVAQAESPGTASRHYAPTTPTRLCTLEDAGGDGVAVITIASGTSGTTPAAGSRFRVDLPDDPTLAAAMLYCTLHAADLSGSSRIDIVPPRVDGDSISWNAVLDRLGRAAATD
jgi:L-threonylcarbamoyladenylate synthase